MTTDRELLEQAAKAAGYEYTVKDDEYYKTHKFFGLWLVIHGEPSEHQRRYWNPLTDDGDALRLAVKLDMDVEVLLDQGITMIHTDTTTSQTEPHNNDPYAATRRAIVRAAAEIGRGM